MNPYSIPNFVVSIYTLSLGIFVLISNPRSKKNQACFLLTFFSFMWLFSYGVMYSMNNYYDAMIFGKVGHTSAIYVSPAVYFFMLAIVGSYKKKIDVILAGFGLVYAMTSSILVWTLPSYLPRLIKHYWGYYPIGGPLMIIYAFWTFFIAVRCIVVFYGTAKIAYKDLNVDDYQRFKYYAISLCIFIIGAADYLPKFGLEIYPFGYILVTGFATITTYAIVRHKLLDVDIIIRRSFVYSLLIFILTFIYLSIILISEYIFQSYIGYRSIFIAIIASLVIAIVFNPLRSKIQKVLDKYFFKIDPEKIMEENIKLKGFVQKADQMKAVATLAAGMAHEIKNPLTSIKTFAEYLPQKYDDPGFREKFSRIVVDEVDRVNNIVKQLLEFSKPKELELKPESITDILDDTLNLLNSNLLKNKIEVTKNYKIRPVIAVDKNQLKQAFLNIFINSIQAMPNGGMLSVGTSLLSTDSCLLITISDTGSGIPKDQLEHIFDPFFSTKEDGTGLGLSIVHGIITKHGGKIEVGSENLKGTSITVTLPAPLSS